MDNATVKTDRFPGLRSFSALETELFFGRLREQEELSQLVLRENVVVLFSKSGLGKTSLLNAGVGPLLEKRSCLLINIRFSRASAGGENPNEDNPPVTPLQIVETTLSRYFDPQRILFDRENRRLWEFIKACEFPDNQQPVLIFDQFEELFYFSQAHQNELMLQLGEIIHLKTPTRIANWLIDVNPLERKAEQMQWLAQPSIKFIFSLRSDFFSHLNRFSSVIPALLTNLYELQGFKAAQARQAIEKPTVIRDTRRFSSPTFSIAPPVLDKIIRHLSDDKTAEIDCSQLQIVCHSIEERVKKIGELEHDPIQVTEVVFNPDRDIDQVLKNFYENQLETIKNEVDRELCRSILEEKLLIEGRRVSLLDWQLFKILDNREILLKELEDTRLIKKEETHLGTTYEISHDALVEPIIQHWREREEKEKWREEKAQLITQAEMYIKEHRAFALAGQYDKAVEAVEAAQGIYDQFDDQCKGQIEARILLSKVYRSQNKEEDALVLLNAALTRALEQKDQYPPGLIYEEIGMVYEDRKDYGNAFYWYTNALTTHEETSDHLAYACLAEHIGGLKEESEHWRISEIYYEDASIKYKVVKDRIGVKRTIVSLERVRKKFRPWGYLVHLFSGAEYELTGTDAVSIGRDVPNQGIFNEINIQGNNISRRHVSITPLQTIEDARSTNGTTLNARPLIYGIPGKLQPNDIIVLANQVPLLYQEKHVEYRKLAPNAWGLVIINSRRSAHYLIERTYSLILLKVTESTNGTAPTRYELSIRKGWQEGAFLRIQYKDHKAWFYIKKHMTDSDQKTEDWVLKTTIKQNEGLYQDYLITPEKLMEAIDYPMEALLKDPDQPNKFITSGPSFQIITNLPTSE